MTNMFTETVTSGTTTTLNAMVHFAHPQEEAPVDRARRLSNKLADFCAANFERGVDLNVMAPYAEAADDLARLGDMLAIGEAFGRQLSSGCTMPGTLFNC